MGATGCPAIRITTTSFNYTIVVIIITISYHYYDYCFGVDRYHHYYYIIVIAATIFFSAHSIITVSLLPPRAALSKAVPVESVQHALEKRHLAVDRACPRAPSTAPTSRLDVFPISARLRRFPVPRPETPGTLRLAVNEPNWVMRRLLDKRQEAGKQHPILVGGGAARPKPALPLALGVRDRRPWDSASIFSARYRDNGMEMKACAQNTQSTGDNLLGILHGEEKHV